MWLLAFSLKMRLAIMAVCLTCHIPAMFKFDMTDNICGVVQMTKFISEDLTCLTSDS